MLTIFKPSSDKNLLTNISDMSQLILSQFLSEIFSSDLSLGVLDEVVVVSRSSYE